MQYLIETFQDIVMFESMRWREKVAIRGLYGKVPANRIVINTITSMQLKYRGKWLLLTCYDLP